MIRELKEQEYQKLYKEQIERDFPRMERRPLFLLKRLHRQGQYRLLVMEDDVTGDMLAYAGLLSATGVDAQLLDYLAVEPGHRGRGIGSLFMKELPAYCDAGGIIIECESPASAKTAEEKAVRERRIAFYLNNGAQETGANWRFFGVDYTLLWLPIHKALGEVNVAQAIAELYGPSRRGHE